MRQISTQDLRRGSRIILDEVRDSGRPIAIVRYKMAAAVLVPVGWYERARQALGEKKENDEVT